MRHQLAQPLDLFVERRAQLRRRHHQRHDAQRLGQLAAGGELRVVRVLRTRRLDGERRDRQPMRVAKRLERVLQALGHLRRPIPGRPLFAQRQFDGGELQVDQRRQHLVLGQVGKAIRRRADKHAGNSSLGQIHAADKAGQDMPYCSG